MLSFPCCGFTLWGVFKRAITWNLYDYVGDEWQIVTRFSSHINVLIWSNCQVEKLNLDNLLHFIQHCWSVAQPVQMINCCIKTHSTRTQSTKINIYYEPSNVIESTTSFDSNWIIRYSLDWFNGISIFLLQCQRFQVLLGYVNKLIVLLGENAVTFGKLFHILFVEFSIQIKLSV